MQTTLRRASTHARATATAASAVPVCREHARAAAPPRPRQRRHLTGTVDLLPKAARPWEVNGGQLFAVGETEGQNGDKDAVKPAAGETVGSLMRYANACSTTTTGSG